MEQTRSSITQQKKKTQKGAPCSKRRVAWVRDHHDHFTMPQPKMLAGRALVCIGDCNRGKVLLDGIG